MFGYSIGSVVKIGHNLFSRHHYLGQSRDVQSSFLYLHTPSGASSGTLRRQVNQD